MTVTLGSGLILPKLADVPPPWNIADPWDRREATDRLEGSPADKQVALDSLRTFLQVLHDHAEEFAQADHYLEAPSTHNPYFWDGFDAWVTNQDAMLTDLTWDKLTPWAQWLRPEKTGQDWTEPPAELLRAAGLTWCRRIVTSCAERILDWFEDLYVRGPLDRYLEELLDLIEWAVPRVGGLRVDLLSAMTLAGGWDAMPHLDRLEASLGPEWQEKIREERDYITEWKLPRNGGNQAKKEVDPSDNSWVLRTSPVLEVEVPATPGPDDVREGGKPGYYRMAVLLQAEFLVPVDEDGAARVLEQNEMRIVPVIDAASLPADGELPELPEGCAAWQRMSGSDLLVPLPYRDSYFLFIDPAGEMIAADDLLDFRNGLELTLLDYDRGKGDGTPEELAAVFARSVVYTPAPGQPGFVPIMESTVIPVYTTLDALERLAGEMRWFSATGAELWDMLPEGHWFIVDPTTPWAVQFKHQP